MKFDYDVLIVGGGPAGLQSAQMLGRAGRTALVCDDGRPRNRPAAHMHYFPTRDGLPPEEFRRLFRSDLAHYPSLHLRDVSVTDLVPKEEGFEGVLADGSRVSARKIILADGVQDILPPIPGLSELFGKTVFHCPYCHGYEFKGKTLGIVGNGEMAFAMTGILRGLSQDLILFTQGASAFSSEQAEALARRGVPIIEETIASFLGEEDGVLIRLDNGREIFRHGILLRPPQKPKSDLGLRLGCRINEQGFYEVDTEAQSSVANVFIAGDGMDPRQSVLTSAYTGMMAAISANHRLAREDMLRD
ncbi:NAD(P)/FAD-dependent oxidoreductase [Oligoflexus tunisiensis]|uniref:NAD(P)/FAD-dependent oxidoreductase n=1 Tax=Oligoflexus tunisiensis TaxID=708132 RepID=UPI000AFD0C8B|nr:NAD(P)/FAD-dependent oxidoreductase [Oligoflexus tunisiensis]